MAMIQNLWRSRQTAASTPSLFCFLSIAFACTHTSVGPPPSSPLKFGAEKPRPTMLTTSQSGLRFHCSSSSRCFRSGGFPSSPRWHINCLLKVVKYAIIDPMMRSECRLIDTCGFHISVFINYWMALCDCESTAASLNLNIAPSTATRALARTLDPKLWSFN